jgi:hypothetical protein
MKEIQGTHKYNTLIFLMLQQMIDVVLWLLIAALSGKIIVRHDKIRTRMNAVAVCLNVLSQQPSRLR